jgi:integrase
MGSLHRQNGKPFWFAAYSIHDPVANRWQRVFRSTKTTNEKQAAEILRAWEKAEREAYNGTLSIDAAREIIEQGVRDAFLRANAALLPSATIKAWCETWLAAKKIEVGDSSYPTYTVVVGRFLDFLGEAASNRHIATLNSTDIARFRNREATQLARGTVNLRLTVLRMCFGEAVRQGLLTSNPAARVDNLKSSAESKRRAFTLDEVRRILRACGDDHEWKGLVLCGLYLGQRLGDLARLTWRAVDLEHDEIAFTAKKTGRRILLPLMPQLVDYFSALPAGDDPNDPIFTRSAIKNTGRLSNQFRGILVEAGLAEPYTANGNKGRSAARELIDVSFHSLRHTATTMLKAAGVSDFMAMQIVGHESSAISRQYSHLSVDDLRRAMSKLPDVSATPTKASRGKKGTKN